LQDDIACGSITHLNLRLLEYKIDGLIQAGGGVSLVNVYKEAVKLILLEKSE
jgi:hypothetical protein